MAHETPDEASVAATSREAERPRRRDAARTRQALLDSARVLVAQHGSHGISTRMVAVHAGVNQALVYRYFGSREGLLAEAVTSETEGITDLLTASPIEDLARTFAEQLAQKTAANDLGKFAVLLSASDDEAIRTEVRAHLEKSFSDSLGQLLGGDDARLRAELVAAIAFGVSYMRVKIGTSALVGADADTLTEVLTRMFETLLAEPE